MGKLSIGLAWVLLPADSGPPWVRLKHETLMHDGGERSGGEASGRDSGGFRAYASVVPETGKAVVVLGSRARSVSGLGVKLMRAL